jgi:hypothetical protein
MAIRLWGQEKLVNTTTLNGQTAPVVSALQNGGYVVAWVDDVGAADSAVKFQRYDALGNKAGLETLVPSPDGQGDQDQVSMITLSNGNFVIANRDVDSYSNGVFTIYGPDGSFIIQTGINSTSTNITDFDIRQLSNGFGISYKFDVGSTTDIGVNLYDNAGSLVNSWGVGSSTADQKSVTLAYSQTNVLAAALYVENNGVNSFIKFQQGSVYSGFNATPMSIFSSSLNALSDPKMIVFNTASGFPNYALSFSLSGSIYSKVVSTFGDSLADYTIVSGSDGELKLLSDNSYVLLWRGLLSGGTQDIHLQQFNDYQKGLLGFPGSGDVIDYSNAALSIGGSAAIATATEASIDAVTGVAGFSAGSGILLADCLADVATRMTTAGDAAGEFAFFKVGAGTVQYMFISDGVAGVGANDVLVQLTTVSSIDSIDITAGDVTILS